MRLSAVDLGGEKHALLETGGGSIRPACDEVLATLVTKAGFEKLLEGSEPGIEQRSGIGDLRCLNDLDDLGGELCPSVDDLETVIRCPCRSRTLTTFETT